MNNINLVYCCDERATKKCLVSMYSALINKSDQDYINFYFIVDKKFSQQCCPEFNILNTETSRIEFLSGDFTDCELYRETTQRTALPVNAYYRLEIPWLLPNEDKALYLDYDTIVLKSLWDMYNIDLTGYFLAAVEDAWKYKRARELNKYQRDMRHYCSGVMLLNLKQWRETNIREKFKKLAKQHKKVFILADQFLINTVINKNVYYLDFSWNLQLPRFERGEPIQYDDLVAYEKSQKNPKIIHYNFGKPWQFTQCTNPFMDLWWYHARKLPFYAELLIEGLYTSLPEPEQILPILNDRKKAEDSGTLPIEEYAKCLSSWFKKQTGENINFNSPKTFNEKIQWLKLYDSTSLKTVTADKYLVRDWVEKKIGAKYLVPLLGVYNQFDDIDFEKLPNTFILKATHGSGWNYAVKDKSKVNFQELRNKFEAWLKTNYAFKFGFELHYKDITPRIIAEKFIENKFGKLYDWKIWCFNGEPTYIQFRDDWGPNLKMCFFDTRWNKQPFYYDHPLYEDKLEKPDNLDEMLHIAKILSKGQIFVCVDLYRLDNGQIYFGEMTYTRSSGVGRWYPDEWNLKLGNLLKLPSNMKEIMKEYNYILPSMTEM